MNNSVKQEIYYKNISKETFKGNWPFKVDSGVLINNYGSIIFKTPRVEYLLWTKKAKYYAINGLAKDRFKRFRKVKRIHLRDDINGFFIPVADIIMEGLKLNPNYK